MEIKTVKITVPEGWNLILGQSHFIKTVEDLYEVMAGSSSNVKFGLAFCESSGPCLVRHAGNDAELENAAAEYAFNLGAGHSFLIILRNAYPINVLNAVKSVPEICCIFCATSNPVEVLVAETEQGRSILGVVDGFKSKAIEQEKEIEERKKFLRQIGYKL